VKHKKERAGWALLAIIILSLILIPFFLFGASVEEWTKVFLDSAKDKRALVACVLAGLLASDILLPVPSSVVSTACGLFLGFTFGALVSLAGMVVSCAIGFWLACIMGRPLASRLVGESEMRRLERLSARLGDWVVVICRPIPVLAEASVLFVGLGQMSTIRFFLLSTLSNLGISAVYAAIGAYAANVNSFLLAVAGSVFLPGVAMLVLRERGRREVAQTASERRQRLIRKT